MTTKTYPTFAPYLSAVLLSCPDEYPESFAYYQAGAWLAEGKFAISDETTLPTRETMPAFWRGYDEAKK